MARTLPRGTYDTRGGAGVADERARERFLAWTVTAPTLEVRRWRDREVERSGHHVDSPYVLRYWVPILGPTAYLALLTLQDHSHLGQPVDLDELAARLGVGGPSSRTNLLGRALWRLNLHHAVRRSGRALEVRSHLAHLAPRLVNRLPPRLAAELAEGDGPAVP